MWLIQSLFQLLNLSGSFRLFVYVFYLKVYFSYNFKYEIISVSLYVGITASAQPYKRTSL